MELLVTYLGKQFENPFVLASGPPTANAEMISRAFEAGWAGAVVKTLIREPVHNLQNRFASIKSGKSIFAFENIELLSEQPPDRWYQDIAILKKRFPDKVVIASIMGDARSRDPWVELDRPRDHGRPAEKSGAAHFSRRQQGGDRSKRKAFFCAEDGKRGETFPAIPWEAQKRWDRSGTEFENKEKRG